MADEATIIRNIRFNRQCLYAGKIGKARELFCLGYIEFKRKMFQEIKTLQSKCAENHGTNISCIEGCHYCCSQFIKASFQECEAIAYYLFNNESKLVDFYSVVNTWQANIYKHPSILQNLYDTERAVLNRDWNPENVEKLSKTATEYTNLGIYCPFLHDNLCLIYEVRPWACASLIATTTAEYCNPHSNNAPNQYAISPLIIEPDLYDDRLNDVLRTEFMPVTVAGIITRSILYYKSFAGLEFLTLEQGADPEVKKIIETYKRS